jgi:hypothetical protein
MKEIERGKCTELHCQKRKKKIPHILGLGSLEGIGCNAKSHMTNGIPIYD